MIEPIIVNKIDVDETWAVGDKCKINTSFREDYTGNYTSMAELAQLEATVVKIVTRQVKFDKGKEDSKFLAKYGKRDVYDSICLWIQYPNRNGTYIVSPFGYYKV